MIVKSHRFLLIVVFYCFTFSIMFSFIFTYRDSTCVILVRHRKGLGSTVVKTQVTGSNTVPNTKKFSDRKSACIHLWHGKTLSCEEYDSLVVRNLPKTVRPRLDWKKKLCEIVSLTHWCRDSSTQAPNKLFVSYWQYWPIGTQRDRAFRPN